MNRRVFDLIIGREDIDREDAESRSNSGGVHPSDSREVEARGESEAPSRYEGTVVHHVATPVAA
jgi:hypothetical protein